MVEMNIVYRVRSVMRILILSQYYKPEPIPKPVELAVELRRRGHSVTVITGFPNYPSGNLYPGYRLGLVKREEIDGIPVIRTWEYPYHGKRALGRFLNYVSFMLSAPLGLFFAPKFDVIYVWHPPLTVGLAAWIIARLRRVPFIYDVQDIWPDAAVLSGLLTEGWMTRWMARLERFIYRQATHLLVVTEGAKENLIAKGVPIEKVSVMSHWVEESLFQRSDPEARHRLREHYGWRDRFVVIFAGNLGLVQGLDTVVQAACLLLKNPKTLIVLVGDGSDKSRLQTLAASLGVQERLQFVGRQPIEKMSDFMAAADVLLVHLKKSELSRFVIPTKTIAYLASGQPILMAMDGAAAQLVNDAGAGLVVQPGSSTALADAIHSLTAISPEELAAMGKRGQDYFRANLSKAKVIPKYEGLLQRVIQVA